MITAVDTIDGQDANRFILFTWIFITGMSTFAACFFFFHLFSNMAN